MPNRIELIRRRIIRDEYRVDCSGVATAMLERFNAVAKLSGVTERDGRDPARSLSDRRQASA